MKRKIALKGVYKAEDHILKMLDSENPELISKNRISVQLKKSVNKNSIGDAMNAYKEEILKHNERIEEMEKAKKLEMEKAKKLEMEKANKSDKKVRQKRKGKNHIYKNGSVVKSFSISTENWEFILNNKEYSYSNTLNRMIDTLKQIKSLSKRLKE